MKVAQIVGIRLPFLTLFECLSKKEAVDLIFRHPVVFVGETKLSEELNRDFNLPGLLCSDFEEVFSFDIKLIALRNYKRYVFELDMNINNTDIYALHQDIVFSTRIVKEWKVEEGITIEIDTALEKLEHAELEELAGKLKLPPLFYTICSTLLIIHDTELVMNDG